MPEPPTKSLSGRSLRIREMNKELLQDFVLMQVYDRLLSLLEEYHMEMHPVIKQMNDVTKVIYEKIFLKIRDEIPLDEKKAHELYVLLKDANEENEGIEELCFQACACFCFPTAKDEIIEHELKNNYYTHSR